MTRRNKQQAPGVSSNMNSVFRSVVCTLALSAMLLRALLPVGWMPEAGGAALVICTADGHATTPPAREHPLPDRGKDICPFAAVAPFAPAPATPLVLAIPQQQERLRFSFAQTHFRAAASYRAQSPRAPPVAV
jgi:hypothetical protein